MLLNADRQGCTGQAASLCWSHCETACLGPTKYVVWLLLQGGSCVMAINSNTFAGEVPPKLDPPSAPALPQYIRGDAGRMHEVNCSLVSGCAGACALPCASLALPV